MEKLEGTHPFTLDTSRYGVIFFNLEKMAVVLGMSNPDVYAQMRGETMAEFQKSRNIGISYSNAGVEGA